MGITGIKLSGSPKKYGGKIIRNSIIKIREQREKTFKKLLE